MKKATLLRTLTFLLILSLTMGIFAPLGVSAAQDDETRNLTDFVGINGNWAIEGNTLRGNNPGMGDAFALSKSSHIDASEPFTYEVKFTINSGNAAGAVFGVADYNNPGANWFCTNIDRGAGNTRLFHVAPTFEEGGRPLTDAEKNTSDFTVKIIHHGDGYFTAYLNDTAVVTNKKYNYNGGYFGLLTFQGDVTFRSATLSKKVTVDNFTTDLSGWKGAVGRWEAMEDGYLGNNKDIGDAFATSDIYLPAGSSFVYETDANIIDGVAVGLVFGVKDRNNPGASWHCLNVDKGAGNTRFFNVNGTGTEGKRDLTEQEKNSSSVHLYVEMKADGTLICKTNGVVVTEQKIDNFAGGYVGLLTFFTKATFNNTTLKYTRPEAEEAAPGELYVPAGSSGSGNATDGYKITGADLYNNFAFLEPWVYAFTYEAEMDFTQNTGLAGLMFGAADPTKLGVDWYAIHINAETKTVRAFYEMDVGGPLDVTVPLSATTDVNGKIPLKITVDYNRTIKIYVGNTFVPIITGTLDNYKGGYLGFMTHRASADFSNVKITVGEPVDYLEYYDLAPVELGQIHGSNVSGSATAGYTFPKVGGNSMAVFDAYTIAMEYEADLEFLNGNSAAGLMFDVDSTSQFGAKWSAVHIQPSRNNTFRIFREENFGSPGGLESGSVALPEGASNSKMHLKLSIDTSNVLRFYVNDMETPLYETLLKNYDGGYVGLMSHDSSVKFSNVSLKGVKFADITSLEIIGAKLNEELVSGRYDYTATLDKGVNEVSIKVSTVVGSVMVNGKLLASGETSEPIKLGTGINSIPIVISDIYGAFTRAAYIRIEKPFDYDDPYGQTYRPQLHYTPQQYWINDPNGLVYNAETGLYHFYYQYNPGVLFHDGQSHWGHAVSSDLVHWKQLPTALYPDKVGCMASGSAVIDRNNTTGFFDDSTPPESRMVAIFTYFTGGPEPGPGGSQRQALAYSKDNGLTWIKYESNSVIPNDNNMYGIDFRDPKVMWMEESQEWLMIVAGGRARIFTSPDLIHWTHNSDLVYKDGSEIHSECPDLFPLPVDGDKNNIKWVYSGAGRFYVIGDLVKQNSKYVFKADTNAIQWYNWDQNSELYATQSFSNTPDGRMILLSWHSESTAEALKHYDKNWNGTFSMPTEAKLITVNGEVRMVTTPVVEMNDLRGDLLYSGSNVVVNSTTKNILDGVMGTVYDIEAELELGNATEFGFNLRVGDGSCTTVKYSLATKMLTVDKTISDVLPAGIKSMKVEPLANNRIKLRIIVDTSVIDVFANDGLASFNTLHFPKADASKMEFFVESGSVTVKSMKIYEMNSMWEGAEVELPAPYLTDITLPEGIPELDFDATVTEYTVNVPEDVAEMRVGVNYAESLTVFCDINGKNVAVYGNINVELEKGRNEVLITVRDAEGSRVYTLTVIRGEDNGEGDDIPGGDNPGGDNPGGDNPGGDNPGGDNPGGDNPGGDDQTEKPTDKPTDKATDPIEDNTTSTPSDTAPVKDKGCGSTMGGAIVLITLIAGAAVIKKRD
ncbi:MAG: GH32 C-terminal domain-containing protein [Clostridia bacterium]|nr:GH32 C-terminal domain-containing protein [Clostridia bacterium]